MIPVYNEEKILPSLFLELGKIRLRNSRIVILNDGSTDKTKEILDSQSSFDFMHLVKNVGKGAAVKIGVENSTEEFFVIYDGDLEYGTSFLTDIDKLASKLKSDTIVYGSRYLDKDSYSNQKKSSIFMNSILVFLYRVLFEIRITDTLTGAKLLPRKDYLALNLNKKGFEADHEVAIKLSKRGLKFFEIPVNYIPRSRSDGKKIRAIDGLKALITVIQEKYNGY